MEVKKNDPEQYNDHENMAACNDDNKLPRNSDDMPQISPHEGKNMMKQSALFILAISWLALLTTGCGGGTTIMYDADNNPIPVVNEFTVSAAEMRYFAKQAVQDVLTNPRFKTFLIEYKKEMKDPNAMPTLKLDTLVNDTNDPDLNVTEMTDILEEALFNANIVNITRAEGAGRRNAIANSRDIINDPNFDERTVQKENTLQAARIVLHPKVTSNEVQEGRSTLVERRFNMDMSDIKTGFVIWKYSRPMAFIRQRSWFGW